MDQVFPTRRQLAAQLWMEPHLFHGGRHLFRIRGLDQEAISAIDDKVRDSADRTGDHGHFQAKRF